MSAIGEMIEVLVEKVEEGGWEVKAPRVGVYRGKPRPGGRRSAGDAVGSLTVLSRAAVLILPPGVDGTVIDVQMEDRTTSVEYGQTLFRLAPLHEPAAAPKRGAPPRTSGELPAGCLAVSCPIDGVFYLRPSPAAPAFAQVGDIVETGRTVGLIEAMKSFNAVTYGGPGLPPRAVIVEARAGDAAEVRQGTVLYVVKPV